MYLLTLAQILYSTQQRPHHLKEATTTMKKVFSRCQVQRSRPTRWTYMRTSLSMTVTLTKPMDRDNPNLIHQMTVMIGKIFDENCLFLCV